LLKNRAKKRAKFLCLAVAGAIITLPSGTVSAQDLRPGINLHPDSQRSPDPDEQAKRKAIDDAYNRQWKNSSIRKN